MNKFIFLIFSIFCIYTCNRGVNQNVKKDFNIDGSIFIKRNELESAKTGVKYNILNTMDTTQVTKDSEKLNIEAFRQKKIGPEYKEQLESGINIHIYEAGGNIYYTESHPDSYYTILKVFYSKGNIKEKGLAINHSLCMVGIWYYFDEAGKFINEVNLDKNYQFAYEDVLKYCKQEEIYVEKGLNYPKDIYFPTEIDRDESEGKSYWNITYFNKKGVLSETINLDGNTGKVISRKSTPITW